MVMAEYVTRNRTPIRVGFYDIVKTIGRGNFAVVKLARHRITKTEVAIKIIDKVRLDQLNLKKIYREIQILKLLNHQNIIKLYQVMETSSKIYLVCEFARNGELFDYITEQGRLPEDKAKRMFWQVLIAVEYCHKNNVVHRDLKAENLLLDSNNNIKLADFGFSNFYQSGSKLSTWCGSPPYAAPEVFEGKLYDGPHLDIWSLGVVLYVLVCGTFPFDGSNLATLKDRVLSGRFRIPYWMSQECENLVRHMLVINPKKRLTVTQIKKHKWMQECVTVPSLSQAANSPKIPRRGKLSEYNEHVLKIMQSLGINRQKIIESLSLSAYDHLYAIYHLLVDRLKLHRTSFPLEGSVMYDGGRRRPSNVAEQALSSMLDNATILPTHQKLNANPTVPMQSSGGDICFDEVTSGLPHLQHTLATPVRYASPPLPKIQTSMYDDTAENSTAANHSLTYQIRQGDDNSTFERKPQLVSVDYKQKSVDLETLRMRNYNLYKRRHTLMVPNPSQMQSLRAGLNSAEHAGHQIILDSTSAAKLCDPREQNAQNLNPQTFSQHACDAPVCTDQACGCIHTKEKTSNPISNMLLPCKNLPNSPELANFNQQNVAIRSQMRRRSGVPTPLIREQLDVGDKMNMGDERIEEKVAFIIRQRQQLDSSPIGFRQGRRASDGLLLLGDNMLKEHLQKLAKVSAVPETTCEDGETSMNSEESSSGNNYLMIPERNPVNRTKSAERTLQVPTSPSATPAGSGSNISYQPYNNSFARRKSLHAQHIQRSIGSSGSQHQYDAIEGNIVPNPQLYAGLNQVEDNQGYANRPVNESSFHWSSWKPVQENKPEGNEDSISTTWQQLAMMKSNAWNDADMSPLTIASDESVAMKATNAQEQRDQKPIRQQSLPITTNAMNHPFGASPNPSMAQMLQQRRLQRRLKVAATNSIHVPGYNLPLPEIEQLSIDTNAGFGPSHGNYAQQANEQEWNEQNWGTQNQFHPGQAFGAPSPVINQKLFSETNSFQDSTLVDHLTRTNPVSNQQFSWSFDFPTFYKKSLEFDATSLLVGENMSNSAERLDHSGTESMEFAMY